mgnify:CR=1 FL=1|jgi:hypothetical protein
MKAIVYVEGKSSPPFEDGVIGIENIDSTSLESIPAAVYEDLELLDVLEFYDKPNVLSIAASKIRHGGILRIFGTDALEIMKGSQSGRMGLAEASGQLLNGRVRMTSAHDVKNSLTELGMEVTTVSILGSRYLVEAKRK